MKKIDFQEICHKFDTKNANKWLSDVIPKSKITFHDACNYLNEPELYRDYQEACSFVHGQDITSKIMPFTFYSTIYAKMFIMMTYIFKTLRLFPIDEALQIEIQNLEEELWDLADFVE